MSDVFDHLFGDNSGLGAKLRALKVETGRPLKDLTVLSKQNDPFRLDTPMNHAIAAWFVTELEKHPQRKTGHLRDFHYAMVKSGKTRKPNRERYISDHDCWTFLEKAAKAARWLGYVPFDRFNDMRNVEPIIRDAQGAGYGTLYLDAPELPDLAEIKPFPALEGVPLQAYRLVFFGEKSTLEDVLRPKADYYHADLYLPTGEMSDTQIEIMARAAANDTRETVVCTFTDCDPSGYQMSVSIAHKLRCLKESFCPDLRFRMIPVALTVDQVKDLGLPSSPISEKDKRKAGWKRKHGVEQTEINALDDDVLERMVDEAVAPYFDPTLQHRYDAARRRWRRRADPILAQGIQDNPDYARALAKGNAHALPRCSAATTRPVQPSRSLRRQPTISNLRLSCPPSMHRKHIRLVAVLSRWCQPT